MIDHKHLITRLRELQDALGRPPEFDDADTLADEAADALEVLIARDKDLKAQILDAHNDFNSIKNILHDTQRQLAAKSA